MDALLQHLRILVAVGDAGGFTAATPRLGRSQPAISRAIARLERGLGVRLLERNGKSSRLAPAGAVLAHRARRALAQLATISPRLAQSVSDRQLRAAIAVAQNGGTAAAGRRLGLSQPAISQALASLEDLLGQHLFLRSNMALRPAPDSEAMLRAFGLAWAEIEQGLEELRFLAGQTDGRLHIGALPLARPMLVPRALDEVLGRFPDARLSIADGPYERLETALRWGELDLIVGSLRGERKDRTGELTTLPLFEDNPVIVCSPDHPARGATDMGGLLRHDWVLPFPGAPLREAFQSALLARGLPLPRRIIETNSITVVRALLRLRHRLALVSEHQVSPDIERGDLSPVPMPAPLRIKARTVGLIMRKDMHQTPLFTALVSALTSVAESRNS